MEDVEVFIEDAKNEISEAFGRIFQSWGYGFTTGIVFGTIYMSNKPIDMKEIAERGKLGISTVHNSLSKLIALGLVTKERKIGGRTSTYRIENPVRSLTQGFVVRVKENARIMLGATEKCRELIKRAEEKGYDRDDLEFYREKIERLRKFYDSTLKTVENILERAKLFEGVE